jgi:methionyl-tRNA formyltransferase
LIDEGCDTGDVIAQRIVPISFEDTGADLLIKYGKLYPQLVLDLFEHVKNGGIVATPQDSSKATYFGKRTPEDGEINWDWQKERIRNWVRAQAYPYPGAFTRLHGDKILVDKISYSEHGFFEQQPNGLVLSLSDGVIVKTCNGAIKLDLIRMNTNIIKEGLILGL